MYLASRSKQNKQFIGCLGTRTNSINQIPSTLITYPLPLAPTPVLSVNDLAAGVRSLTKEAITEDVLVKYLQSQDNRAITLLYDAYAPALYGVILRIVKSDVLAEDVLQECFIKIWTSFELYDSSKGKLFTWLLNIARYAAIDKLRSRSYLKSLKTHSLEITTKEKMVTQDFLPEHIGIRELTAKLSFKHKRIIDLMYFEGFSQQEIAQELNIPLGTVKTLSRRAIQLLRLFIC